MEARKLLLGAILLLGLCLAANPSAAIVVTSLPGGTVYAMPAVNYFGPGPQSFGPGIVWTSTNATNNGGSVFGFTTLYSFGMPLNGDWDGALGPMAGLNDSFLDYGVTDTMTFTLPRPVKGVGGFMNYAPPTTVPIPTTIAVYDSTHTLIESYNLTFLTSGANDTGEFLGFLESSPIIKYFTLTDNFIGITDLTTVPSVPLPGAVWLLGSGLAGLLGLRRFRKQ